MGSPESPKVAIDGLQKYSCVLCSQRKVRCERVEPCAGCVKAQVPCIFRAPPPPRRGKRKSPEELHQARLKRYEEVMKASETELHNTKNHSVSLEDVTRNASQQQLLSSIDSSKSAKSTDTGKLVVEGVRTRYIESGLWKVLSDETSKDAFHGFSDETDETPEESSSVNSPLDDNSLVLGISFVSANLSSLHPQPVHMFKLWQIFLENVDPVSKVIHAPTVQQQILEASENLRTISKPLEALMFTIYTLAVVSLEENDCEGMFRESKASLVERYRRACRQALINANFLQTSDLTVLQAYVLFLLSMRTQAEPESFWSLTGISVRIAQRIGLHRDGTTLGLPPFQVELRRRLWWQIAVLDGQTAQLTGSGPSLLSNHADTKLPLNVNDSDLYPDMIYVPTEHKGPTQMSFSLLRYDICAYLQRAQALPGSHANSVTDNERLSAAERNNTIDDIETKFEENYIRSHDRSIPIHFLTMHVAALAVCKMRWLAHNPLRWQLERDGTPQSLEDSDMLFSTALKFLDCELMLRSNPAIQRFRWHSQSQSQWHTFVFVLSEVRRRCDRRELDKDIARAWSLIEQAIQFRPDVISDHKKALHVAVCNVALAAWKSYEVASGDKPLSTPLFVTILRDKMTMRSNESKAKMELSRASQILNDANEVHHPSVKNKSPRQDSNTEQMWQNTAKSSEFCCSQEAPFDYMSIALDPIDWSDWDHLLQTVDSSGPGCEEQFFPP